MAETFVITAQDVVDEAVLAGIEAPLDDFNTVTAGHDNFLPFAVLIRDKGDGQILAGLCGHTAYDWMFIKLFFIPETLRGHRLGQRLLAQAEGTARARNCTGVWLDTFGFQARGFYEKQGYKVFGEIADYPKGFSRFFLQKRLDEGASTRGA